MTGVGQPGFPQQSTRVGSGRGPGLDPGDLPVQTGFPS